MKESLFLSSRRSAPRTSLLRWSLCGVALLSAVALVPDTVTAKEPKTSKKPPVDSEARSKELLKKHFPLEEDIGPLPVVRVPKVEPGRRPAVAKPRVEPKEVPPPVVARPADPTPPPAEPPMEKAALAAPPKKEAPRAETPPSGVVGLREQASALGNEDSQQIDDLVSRALGDPEIPAAEPEAAAPPAAEANLPPLDIAAIKQSMQGVQPEVKRSCRLGRLGVVQVRVVVRPSGEVARVTPEGKFARTPLGPCVVERVKRARFPMSAGGSFQYTLTVR